MKMKNFLSVIIGKGLADFFSAATKFIILCHENSYRQIPFMRH